ncbi:MAG: hypothetical protein QOG45_879 [Chloroflexota bacterium]|nr:hypothetical protein [Chloroflexota bacterium]
MIHVDATRLRSVLGLRSMEARHGVADHPLLTLEALAELADRLPPDAIERNPVDLPLLLPEGGNPPGGIAAPGAAVRAVPQAGSWIVLWHIERDPAYRRLVDDLLDEVEPIVSRTRRDMRRREAFVFISSARARTPVHIDPEHNLLLQITGVKRVRVGAFATEAEAQSVIERYYDGGHRNLDVCPAEAAECVLEKGVGVYIPPMAPHWVENGDAPLSVALSITFRTRESQRREHACELNARLRRLGLHPRPAGRSGVADAAKAFGWRRYRALRMLPRTSSTGVPRARR